MMRDCWPQSCRTTLYLLPAIWEHIPCHGDREPHKKCQREYLNLRKRQQQEDGKLQTEELHNLYSSPIIRVMKSRKIDQQDIYMYEEYKKESCDSSVFITTRLWAG
jgi:hypothetical protein